MSVLAQQRLYRIPCKSFALKDSVQESDVHSCIDVSHAFAILNPSGDLLNTEETLLPLLQRNKTCTIVRGTPPRDMCTAMTLYDILLFFGHGNAQEYLPPSSVWIGWRAVMILMGCSSGALVSQEDIGLDGIVFSYLLAGTPSVVANLWDVTDKDIDRFSSALVGAWFKHADLPVYSTLSSSVSLARTQCQLQFLTGAAPVVYGLPVSLRNSN
jgi:separase|tara:strand:+ start:192 stop:830 length:639 start_codon:yes stop_codon:yes gene_type:complete